MIRPSDDRLVQSRHDHPEHRQRLVDEDGELGLDDGLGAEEMADDRPEQGEERAEEQSGQIPAEQLARRLAQRRLIGHEEVEHVREQMRRGLVAVARAIQARRQGRCPLDARQRRDIDVVDDGLGQGDEDAGQGTPLLDQPPDHLLGLFAAARVDRHHVASDIERTDAERLQTPLPPLKRLIPRRDQRRRRSIELVQEPLQPRELLRTRHRSLVVVDGQREE